MTETPCLVAAVSCSLRVGFLGRETQGSPAHGKPMHQAGKQSPRKHLCVLAGAHGGTMGYYAHLSKYQDAWVLVISDFLVLVMGCELCFPGE